MTGEVVLVCTPVSYLVGKISPDDAILIEWQLQERDVIVEMSDSLVGDDGAENQEQKQGETCNASQNPVLHQNGVCQRCQRGDETEVREEMIHCHQRHHRLGSGQTLAGCLEVKVDVVPSLVGRFIVDEPCIAVQLYCSISVGSILVDQEVIFSAHILQVALIALLAHEVALSEGYVWHVGAVAVAELGTAE